MGALATAGTAIGILFAPKVGKKTREDLKKKTDDTVETIKATFQKSEDAKEDSVDHTEQEYVMLSKMYMKKQKGKKGY